MCIHLNNLSISFSTPDRVSILNHIHNQTFFCARHHITWYNRTNRRFLTILRCNLITQRWHTTKSDSHTFVVIFVFQAILIQIWDKCILTFLLLIINRALINFVWRNNFYLRNQHITILNICAHLCHFTHLCINFTIIVSQFFL